MSIKPKKPKISNPSTSVARTQRKWQIRGIRTDGKRLAFPVLAFDHLEASKVAQKKSRGAQITDIVLLD
jgi:hypothetical protein